MSGFWLMVAVVVSAALAFVAVMVWLSQRQKEREAHYQSEMARRISEAGDPEPIMAFLRERETAEAERAQEKTRMGGWVNIGVGIATVIALYPLEPDISLFGLIPAAVGIVLLLATRR